MTTSRRRTSRRAASRSKLQHKERDPFEPKDDSDSKAFEELRPVLPPGMRRRAAAAPAPAPARRRPSRARMPAAAPPAPVVAPVERMSAAPPPAAVASDRGARRAAADEAARSVAISDARLRQIKSAAIDVGKAVVEFFAPRVGPLRLLSRAAQTRMVRAS